ncbi:MAG: hypothetical protein ACTSW1_00640 [Candidatus Hodarchaeales archaeon]
MLKKADWADLVGIKPPLIERIIQDSMETTGLINQMLGYKEITKANAKELIDIRQRIHSIKTNILSILCLLAPDKEKPPLKSIKDDFDLVEEQIVDLQRKENWIADVRIYAILERLLFILSNFYHALRETHNSFYFLEQDLIDEIRKKFYESLNLINKNCFYYFSLQPDGKVLDRIRKSFIDITSFVKEEKREVFFQDLRNYGYLFVLINPPKKRKYPKSEFTGLITEGLNVEDVDKFVFENELSYLESIVSYLKKFEPVQITTCVYGLLKRDRMQYYALLLDTLKRRSGWAVPVEAEEKKIKIEEVKEKAKVEAGEGE